LIRGPNLTKKYKTAVSLHSHSELSREGLGFVPRYASRIPILSTFYRLEQNRYLAKKGIGFDFRRAYWIPPLSPESVLESERKRIESDLQMHALVSLSDHDTVSKIGSSPPCLEWTVSINSIELHLGIYNLPSDQAKNISSQLVTQSGRLNQRRLLELLSWLNENQDVLIVLNHPFADLTSSGSERVKQTVMELIRKGRDIIHALEINGYRPWKENKEIAQLAARFSLGLVGGGDRHGYAPNAILSLTNAHTFCEYVEEVRYDRRGIVAIMPEYCKNLVARKLQAAVDFFRFPPTGWATNQHWMDRVFFQLEDGVVRPLSYYWNHTIPLWAKPATWFLQLLASRYAWSTIQALFRSNEIPLSSAQVAVLSDWENSFLLSHS